MILHARWQGSHHSTRPVLVWLHGFLGSGEEWQPVQTYFNHWPQLSIDLPGHGGSGCQRVSDFDQLSERLNATLRHHRLQRYWLIGYSLGGRVSLCYACRHVPDGLQGVIVEGGHYGLDSTSARRERLEHDQRWAEKFCRQPLSQTLDEWYRQPVFVDLTSTEREALIRLRVNQHPNALADMLMATSLARQPCLLPELHRLPRLHYLCGERDHKFCQLAEQASLPFDLVPAAGHNAHRANPAAFAALLTRLITGF
ncbi:2-succinyl-6-hydroxy-2,4-cyclohexadiene-1-carboxylate synthase [Erwinia psidii]|uniref:2-succinyl-6-hydroxy-2,4-cyclohexadiene-1-carboxylate synthase n=1 Tax=Erwinia psidii TaxID=69224 RepID=A0A3N6SJ02_9GAMM|nr:2-succinyl-6-hydroxy-2,4-cyclohexadiene-1-carboxylate synthase [Erwinia psidii]MCX8956590.1 2-succinyl-6-hydroxy-2,4-cyclohexadiene-1-carboxylate synthase [Erwinia psidii]MCX8961500.1 2-succinyl-6-hydroxy-2,4-cyclohexadiene-1-carboxylate synthase [Erwinia psidii]MCX8965032.1 2-succinyl-6-hydroxy-2,4-cyclohexadiene-1-carboxylate synthase [Erwinia psidii]RQM39923.1 2-succinyl-6-hydroxy-2,4-cyclohexadiene-1-carboxylate synthase [Erwinia psidii]